MTRIRPASANDADGIRELYLAAFPESERETIARLALELLAMPAKSQVFNLVADDEGEVNGHVTFSPVTSDTDNEWSGYILAPLAVLPDCQNQGLGSALIEHGMKLVGEIGASTLFVYGDPAYYERFGFSEDNTKQFQAPYPLEYPFGWQAIVLNQDQQPSSPITLHCVPPLSKPDLW